MHINYNTSIQQMKKILFLAAMLLVFSTADCYGQKWLDKAIKVLDQTDRTLGHLTGTSSNESSTATEPVTTRTSTEQVESTGGVFKISTGYPDLKVKVKRSVASERTLIIDMTFENVGSDDVNDFEIYGSFYRATAIDDEGNEYSSIQVSLGNGTIGSHSRSKLFAETPIKGRVKIEGLSSRATMIRALQIPYSSSKWGNETRIITIKNLPISRDDDE